MWAHDSYPPIEGEVTIEYCKKCGMPYDYCDFGGMWSICKEVATEVYPNIYSEGHVANVEKKKIEKKKNDDNKVTIQRVLRAKRKVVTVVNGLHLFGVKLDNASKLISKQFATGASVVRGIPGQSDKIDIQGDVESLIVDFVKQCFTSIPDDKIAILPPKL